MSEPDYRRFDALMKLADFRRQYRDTRRSIEWRVNLAAWAVMVGLIVTLKNYASWQAISAAFVITALHFLWVRWNFRSNERDSKPMWNHYDNARKVLQIKEAEPPKKLNTLFQHFPAFAAVIVTFVLDAAVIALLWQNKWQGPIHYGLGE